MTLDLRRPHGFLLWRGKKTAVLRPEEEPLPVDLGLEARTGAEAFGIAVLGDPAKMLASEADRKEWQARHRVYPKERGAWWPGAERFLVYPVESFTPYPQPRRDWEGLKEATEDCCPACVQEGGGWCRLHDAEVGPGLACADWAEPEDWRAEKYEASQRREPSGSPIGGRWTSSGGEGSILSEFEGDQASVANAFSEALGRAADTGHEVFIGINKDGTRKGKTHEGEEGSVDGGDAADAFIEIHTHPWESLSFSVNDVMGFANREQARHMLVIAADGAIFRMSKPKGFSYNKQVSDIILAEGQNAGKRFMDIMEAAGGHGKISQDVAYQRFSHAQSADLAKQLGFEYERANH